MGLESKLFEKTRERENKKLEGIVSPEKLEEKRLSFGRTAYHIVTALPTTVLSYTTAGIGGLLFTSFLTLGGVAKRKRQKQRFSGEKTFKDIKAGSVFSPLVNGLYSLVNSYENPVVKTLALNPVSYAIFNGTYLAYTNFRDKMGKQALKSYTQLKRGVKETYNFLKKEWMPLNRKMLGFLPVNYANVNLIKKQWLQVGVGSMIDFFYGLITTKKANTGEKNYNKMYKRYKNNIKKSKIPPLGTTLP